MVSPGHTVGPVHRRDFLKALGVGLGALAISGCSTLQIGSKGKRRNVLFVIVDDPGYFDFTFGAKRQSPTPNIDSIAEGGARFENAYASCFVCSPSRAGMMTARYQNRFGHEYNPGGYEMTADTFGLPPSEITMGEALHSLGYRTGYIGKWHLGYRPGMRPLECGFDEYFGFLGGAISYYSRLETPFMFVQRGDERVEEKEYLTHAFSREAVSFIERHSDSSKPFFLVLAYNAVHFPWEAPPEDVATFPEDVPEVHESNAPGCRRAMLAMIKALDDGMGRVLDALKRTGAEQDTLVFFVGDNGGPRNMVNTPLNGFKYEPLEGGLRVPFAVRWPGRIRPGTTYRGITSALDIFPTAVAAAGGQMPDDRPIDGVDLMPYLRGEKDGHPHESLCWRYGQTYAVRRGEWKLIRWPDVNQALRRPAGFEELSLFNLIEDPGETRNLAAARPDIVQELDKIRAAWEAEMVEPRWSESSNFELLARRQRGLPEKRTGDNIYADLDKEVGFVRKR